MSDPRSQTGKHLAEVLYAVLTERQERLDGLKARLAQLAAELDAVAQLLEEREWLKTLPGGTPGDAA